MGSTPQQLRQAVVSYYERCERDYRWIWDLDRSLAMHLGIWDGGTRTLRDALARQNELLAEEARIGAGDRVLDAGCGVGGSAIFLARRYGARIVGVTLSRRQAASARAHAARHGVADHTAFLAGDFTALPIPEASFDVVWACESVCYAGSKRRFACEASRVLVPGGRLILADGFAGRPTSDGVERRLFGRWAEGWALPGLDTAERFADHLRAAGFGGLRFTDVTAAVLPSTRRLFLHSLYALPTAWLAQRLGAWDRVHIGNTVAAFYTHRLCRRNLLRYGVFYAEKQSAALAPARRRAVATVLSAYRARALQPRPRSRPKARIKL